MRQAIGAGGHLAKQLPGYEPRSGQLRLSLAVDAAIRDGRHLFAEGPCGTGKGIAYLVPAIHHAIERRKKVVVATATINLQDQLVRSDLAILRKSLPTPFTFAVAKGRSNFLCSEAFDENDGASNDPKWAEVARWAATTQTGDVGELPFEAGPLRRLFTVSSDECPGQACPGFEGCLAEKAKREFFAADVVVTNYHLLLLDLKAKKGDPAARGPLPPWDIAILDEAHHLPDVARDLLGWEVTKGGCDQIAQALAGKEDLDAELAADIRSEAAGFFSDLLSLSKSDEYEVRFREEGQVDGSELATLLRRAEGIFEREAELAEPRRKARMQNLARQSLLAAFRLDAAAELKEPERNVYCIEVDVDSAGRERAKLASKLIWPADVLRKQLFGVPNRTCVMTSATLAADGSFDFIARECGAENARELAVPSPFDFERQTLLVVPKEMPDPKKRAEHERYVAEMMVEIAWASKGRMLGLFTSRRGLKAAVEAFEDAEREGERTAFVEDMAPSLHPWREVLVQGTAPRGQLVQRFREGFDGQGRGSVLLGLESFWEGVDVPGEALSVVVIDRIPFTTPDDPILDAVDDLLPKGAFEQWDLPRAIMSIRQGFGRLVRSKTDRGVVVILDERILTKWYGRRFIDSLPDAPLSRDLGDVPRFLSGKIRS